MRVKDLKSLSIHINKVLVVAKYYVKRVRLTAESTSYSRNPELMLVPGVIEGPVYSKSWVITMMSRSTDTYPSKGLSCLCRDRRRILGIINLQSKSDKRTGRVTNLIRNAHSSGPHGYFAERFQLAGLIFRHEDIDSLSPKNIYKALVQFFFSEKNESHWRWHEG